jgi:hypothetical protein
MAVGQSQTFPFKVDSTCETEETKADRSQARPHRPNEEAGVAEVNVPRDVREGGVRAGRPKMSATGCPLRRRTKRATRSKARSRRIPTRPRSTACAGSRSATRPRPPVRRSPRSARARALRQRTPSFSGFRPRLRRAGWRAGFVAELCEKHAGKHGGEELQVHLACLAAPPGFHHSRAPLVIKT